MAASLRAIRFLRLKPLKLSSTPNATASNISATCCASAIPASSTRGALQVACFLAPSPMPPGQWFRRKQRFSVLIVMSRDFGSAKARGPALSRAHTTRAGTWMGPGRDGGNMSRICAPLAIAAWRTSLRPRLSDPMHPIPGPGWRPAGCDSHPVIDSASGYASRSGDRARLGWAEELCAGDNRDRESRAVGFPSSALIARGLDTGLLPRRCPSPFATWTHLDCGVVRS